MEADEIGVVLARAAELHAKISDAIERSMKLEFQSGAGGGGGGGGGKYASILNAGEAGAAAAAAVLGYGGKSFSGRGDYPTDLIYDDGGSARGAVADGSAEARSLGAIRDALEVLEEQLEALQCLQQQQRHEKDAALVDLEESRHILLRRLKAHRGREWEVVHEALAFAGEPVPERPDELPLPPYPRPVPSPSYALEPRSPQFNVGPVGVRGNAAVKKLDLAAAQGHRAGGDEDEDFNGNGAVDESRQGRQEEDREEGTDSQHHHQEVDKSKKPVPGLSVPRDILRLLAHAFGVSAKAIGVVTVIAVIGYSEAKKRKASHRRSKYIARRSAPAPPPPIKDAPEEHQCPPGKVRILLDGVPKCVVKERFEMPFRKEVSAPDVMFGRG